jgi:hypothetical protein
MVAALVLASAINVADKVPSTRHVRSTDEGIRVLVEKGVARSATFRRLLDLLDASDVIVYIDRKLTREALDGYLLHHITIAGPMRYLHVKVDIKGSDIRAIGNIAHELQHAVEVAQATDVRDDRSLTLLFERTHFLFGCAGDCFETKAAIDVEDDVIAELKATKPPSTLASGR